MTDPISDMLTRIRNALMARHSVVSIPASKLKLRIAEILEAEGFIKGYRVESDDRQGMIQVDLKYLPDNSGAISGLKRVSRPGLRRYEGRDGIPKVRAGLGVAIVSTSKGVMTDHDARRAGVGGEILCEVW
jgi:small subunit ribosomal protein S8